MRLQTSPSLYHFRPQEDMFLHYLRIRVLNMSLATNPTSHMGSRCSPLGDNELLELENFLAT